MSEQSDDGDNGGESKVLRTAKAIGIMIIAVLAIVYGIKITAWVVKTALWVGAVAAVGYVGYSLLVKKRLTSDEPPADKPRKALPAPAVDEPKAPRAADVPKPASVPKAARAKAADQDDALADLKRKMAQLGDMDD